MFTSSRRWSGTAEPSLDEVPDGYPTHRIAEEDLASGRRVRFRPILPDDAVELRAGLQRLSDRTKWLRFHAPISELSAAQLRYLAEVDHHDREALVVEVHVGSWHRPGSRHWQPAGVARYDRTGPDRAEIAIVIEDAWQGRGLGGRLLRRLAAAAREEGVTRFEAEVLAENTAMLAMLRKLGPVATEADGTVVHAVVTIASRKPARPR